MTWFKPPLFLLWPCLLALTGCCSGSSSDSQSFSFSLESDYSSHSSSSSSSSSNSFFLPPKGKTAKGVRRKDKGNKQASRSLTFHSSSSSSSSYDSRPWRHSREESFTISNESIDIEQPPTRRRTFLRTKSFDPLRIPFPMLPSSPDGYIDGLQLRDFLFIRHISSSVNAVNLCLNRETNMLVAIKTINRIDHSDPLRPWAVKNEIRSLIMLQANPFVVQYFGKIERRSDINLVMEYVPGVTLERIIFPNSESLHRPNLQLRKDVMANAKFFAAELLVAVEMMHKKGIVHGDLKPSNIVLTRDGHLCLIDFGASIHINNPATKLPLAVPGTRFYAAPEVITRGRRGIPSDWYAVGMIIYILLTGQLPYNINSPFLVANILHKDPYFPRSMGRNAIGVVDALMEKSPSLRWGYHDPVSMRFLKMHPFFKNIDWNMMAEKRIESPVRYEIIGMDL